jgi:hypothetical protein
MNESNFNPLTEKVATAVDRELGPEVGAEQLQNWAVSMIRPEVKAALVGAHEATSPQAALAQKLFEGITYRLAYNYIQQHGTSTEERQNLTQKVLQGDPDPLIAEALNQQLTIIAAAPDTVDGQALLKTK